MKFSEMAKMVENGEMTEEEFNKAIEEKEAKKHAETVKIFKESQKRAMERSAMNEWGGIKDERKNTILQQHKMDFKW